MTWRDRHELIINGIDFDAALERAKNEIFQKIDMYFLNQYFDHVNQIKEIAFNSLGIPKT